MVWFGSALSTRVSLSPRRLLVKKETDSEEEEEASMMMRLRYSLFFILLSLIALQGFAKKTGDVSELQIGVKYKPKTCELKAHKGDKIKVHYRGKLTDGTVFDSSFERGDPFEFVLGSGQVIKGWDQGLLGACVGEKRKLKIPAKLGYGEQGSPPTIPGGATLIFDTELVAVNEKPAGGEEEDGGDEDDEL